MEEAHEAIDRLRQIDPKSGIVDAQYLWPFRRCRIKRDYMERLRKAGLPE